MTVGVRKVFMFLSFVASCATAGASDLNRDSSPGQGDTLASFYGNTLVCRDGGIESHFYYRPDHTFSGKVPAYYMEFKGTWKQMADGSICRVFDPPLPTLKNPDCGPVFVRKIGDKNRQPDGHAEKLVAGIQ